MTVARAITAGAWSALDVAMRQGVQFAVSIVLARLLAPEQFGLFAIVIMFTTVSVVFLQGGLTYSLIQRNDTTPVQESTIFWINLIASGVFAAALWLGGGVIGRFFGEPALQPLLLAAGVSIILTAFGAVHSAMLTRSLDFRAHAKVGALSTLSSGALSVWAALAGFGVWALLIQVVSMAAVSSVAMWVLSSWRPQWRLDLRSVRDLVGFGGPLMISSTLEVVFAQSFTFVIGKMFGVRDLGFFTRASGTQALPSGILMSTMSRVALALFSERKNEPEALRRGLRLAQSWATLVNLPMMVGLAILSDLVMICLFGEKWVGAAPLLSILAIGGILTPLHSMNIQVLLGLGKAKTYLTLGLQKMALGLVCLLIGAYWGLTGVAWALVINSALCLVLNTRPVCQAIGYGFWRQLWDLRDVALVTIVMGFTVVLAKSQLELSPWINLILLSLLGALVYVAVGLISGAPSFTDALAAARETVQRKLARPRSVHGAE
jgi:O-antigen/teichoic acid export membrane protein